MLFPPRYFKPSNENKVCSRWDREHCGPKESWEISWKSWILNEWDLDRTEGEHSKYRRIERVERYPQKSGSRC